MNLPAVLGGKPASPIKLNYGRQYIDEDDIAAVNEVLRSDYLTCGPKIKQLEDFICNMIGAKYCVAVNSATSALHMAAMAAGVKAGDEVIVPPLTFAASANCVLYCGGTPVFTDVDPKHYCINPVNIAKNITKETRAVIAVDYAGVTCDYDEIIKICKANSLLLIEDAAHSIGSTYKGRRVGTLADMTVFSFHPVKTVTSGEGGAITTDSETLYKKLLLYRSHGITREEDSAGFDPYAKTLIHDVAADLSMPGWYNAQVCMGYNYRLTDIQAALLISQLKKLPLFIEKRKELVSLYDEAFAANKAVVTQMAPQYCEAVRHLYTIRLNTDFIKINRRGFFDAMLAENIGVQVHYLPVYWHPYYQSLGYEMGLCPNAEDIYCHIMSIPLHFNLSRAQAQDVVTAVNKLTQYYGNEID